MTRPVDFARTGPAIFFFFWSSSSAVCSVAALATVVAASSVTLLSDLAAAVEAFTVAAELSPAVLTFFEPRFEHFLGRYDSVFPLRANEVRFLREAYRFFVLNYVARLGEHFFKEDLRVRLLREAIDYYLPELDRLDFDALAKSCQA